MSKQPLTDVLARIPRPTPTLHNDTYDRISPAKTTFEAQGKTVLIIAGGTGIGFETSKAFAEAGVARIIIISRRPEPQAQAKATLEKQFPNLKVETHAASVTDHAKMTEILQSAGDIDVLVISHSYIHKMQPGVFVPVAEMQQTYDTNIVANFNIVQSYLSLPKPAAGTKTVIFVSSCSSHMQIPMHVGYGSSKAAFNQMMSFFAEENKVKDGVRMFSFHPGAFFTEETEKHYPKDAFEWQDIRLAGHFAVWLASREADFLHGSFVWAQWDVDEMIELFPKRIENEYYFLKMALGL